MEGQQMSTCCEREIEVFQEVTEEEITVLLECYEQEITVLLECYEQEIEVQEEFVVVGITAETFDGQYSVRSDWDEQELPTQGKVMANDVVVLPIYISSTTNFTGGNTVYIGGIIDA